MLFTFFFNLLKNAMIITFTCEEHLINFDQCILYKIKGNWNWSLQMILNTDCLRQIM